MDQGSKRVHIRFEETGGRSVDFLQKRVKDQRMKNQNSVFNKFDFSLKKERKSGGIGRQNRKQTTVQSKLTKVIKKKKKKKKRTASAGGGQGERKNRRGFRRKKSQLQG